MFPLWLSACASNAAATKPILHEEISVDSGDACLAARISSPSRDERYPGIVVVLTYDKERRRRADHSLNVAGRPALYWEDVIEWLRSKRFLG